MFKDLKHFECRLRSSNPGSTMLHGTQITCLIRWIQQRMPRAGQRSAQGGPDCSAAAQAAASSQGSRWRQPLRKRWPSFRDLLTRWHGCQQKAGARQATKKILIRRRSRNVCASFGVWRFPPRPYCGHWNCSCETTRYVFAVDELRWLQSAAQSNGRSGRMMSAVFTFHYSL